MPGTGRGPMSKVTLDGVTHACAYFVSGLWSTSCGVRFQRILMTNGFETLDGRSIVMSPSREVDCVACVAQGSRP